MDKYDKDLSEISMGLTDIYSKELALDIEIKELSLSVEKMKQKSKQMKAEKMFKELGYIRHTESRGYNIVQEDTEYFDLIAYCNEHGHLRIDFDLKYEEVAVYQDYERYGAEVGDPECASATKEEMKAIVQQCKELGWLW